MIQDGARRHYAVPIALQRAGILGRVYTDWYASPGSTEARLSRMIGSLSPHQGRAMSERFAEELDVAKVFSNPALIIPQILGQRLKAKSETSYFAAISRRIGRWICRVGFGPCNGIYGFVRSIDPAVCELARQRGLIVMTDQMIAPFEVESRETRLQEQRFPGWSSEPHPVPGDSDLTHIERRTWALSDRVVCASDDVRRGLISCGVEDGKIAVLPPPFNARNIRPVDRRSRPAPITVGFVGKVGLRKGTPYFFQVARRFDSAKVRFVMVGALTLNRAIADRERGAVELVGAVPRSEIGSWLERFDIMLFPSTCEGSAGVVNEAMAAALPVVTSPNAGSIVRDGVDGFITAYDDVDAMTDRIEQLIASAERRHEMGLAGRQHVSAFGLDQYGQQLAELYRQPSNPLR